MDRFSKKWLPSEFSRGVFHQMGPALTGSFGAGAAGGATSGATLGPIGAGVGAVVGGLGGLFGGLFGGGPPDTRLKLTPELEAQMMNEFQRSLTEIDEGRQRIGQALEVYNQRSQVIEGLINRTIPSEEGTSRLNEMAFNLAQVFGGSAAEAVKNGFLDPESAKSAGLIEEREGKFFDFQQQELSRLAGLESADFRDPRVEQQLSEQKRQLEQDLARRGVSPFLRSIAMSKFEQGALETRFSTAEQLRSGATQRGLARIESARTGVTTSSALLSEALRLRAEGRARTLSEALTMAQFTQSEAQRRTQLTQQGAASLQEQAQAGFGVAGAATGIQQQLRQEKQAGFSEIGRFNLSDRIKNALSQGQVGPGTFESQLRGGGSVSQPSTTPLVGRLQSSSLLKGPDASIYRQRFQDLLKNQGYSPDQARRLITKV